MDGKRKKIADVEAQWEEKIDFFSSRIEELTARIETLEQRILNLEKSKESNKTLEKCQKAFLVKGKNFATFSKEKIYPVLHSCGIWLWQKSCKIFSWLKEFSKIKAKQWGYGKTALFLGIFLCVFGLLLFQPWQNFLKKETVSTQEVSTQKVSVSAQKVSTQENKSSISPLPLVHPKKPIEQKKSYSPQSPPEEKKISAIPPIQEERDDLPLITKLIQQSQAGEMDNRYQAIDGLGKMNSPSASRQLCQLLKDPNADIRWYSLRTLNSTKGDRASLASLMEILNDSQESIDFQREAMRTLANLGGKFIEFTSSEKKFLLDVLLDTSRDEELRSNAAYALSNIGNAGISSKIVPLLSDPSSLVREMVAYTLGSFSYPHADKELLELMKKDENVQVRLAAVQALSKIDSKVASIAPELFEQWK